MALSLAIPADTASFHRSLRHGGFFACWQVQSKLAAIALLALVAVSPWLALAVMMVWSSAATVVYHAARERGVPDLMTSPAGSGRAMRAGQIAGRVWLVGLNAYAFANILRPVLSRPSPVARGAVIAAGLTFFGVTTSLHMLQCAGFRGGRLLGMSLAGSLLNVPYRVFCGALTLQLVSGLVSESLPAPYL